MSADDTPTEPAPRPVSYPSPEVLRLTGHRPTPGLGITWWPATEHDPEHYTIGWTAMSRAQVRAFARQLLAITGDPPGGQASSALAELPGRHAALAAVVAVLTGDEARLIEQGSWRRWPALSGKPVTDVLVHVDAWGVYDGELAEFLAAEPGLGADPRARWAVLALLRLGRLLYKPTVAGLLARAPA